jgi:hypothetical protein
LRHRPVIESAPTFAELEPDLEEEDLDSADYDTQHEHDLEPAYGRNDEQRVAAPPATHARRRTSRNEEHKRKRASLSYLTRLLVVLLILAGLVAAVSWQWSTVAHLYQFLGRLGQQLQKQVSGDNPSAKPEFWPRVRQEQAGGQALGTAAPASQTAAVASLIEADPSDPKGKRYVGSVIWRTETVSAGPGVALLDRNRRHKACPDETVGLRAPGHGSDGRIGRLSGTSLVGNIEQAVYCELDPRGETP